MATKKKIYKNKKRKTQVYKNKITKKRVYNKKNKVLKGGANTSVTIDKVDSQGALILNNAFNNNGSNYCWLNATLYAFVAFKPIIDIYTTFNCPKNKTFTTDDYVIINGLNDNYSISNIIYIDLYENNNDNTIIKITLDNINYIKIKDAIIKKLADNFIKELPELITLKKNTVTNKIIGAYIYLVVKTSCLKYQSKLTEKEDEIHKEIYKLMLESRKPDTLWNNNLYENIHKKLCLLMSCGNTQASNMINPGSGNFSNPQPVLVTFSELLLKKCLQYYSPLRIEAMTICADNVKNRNTDYSNLINGIKTESDEAMEDWITNNSEEYSKAEKQKFIESHKKKKIKSIIVSNSTSIKTSKIKDIIINVGHFIAYSIHKTDDLWKKYDSGKTINNDKYIYNRDTMFNIDLTKKDHVWYIYAIYFDEDYLSNPILIPPTENTSICNLLTSYKELTKK